MTRPLPSSIIFASFILFGCNNDPAWTHEVEDPVHDVSALGESWLRPCPVGVHAALFGTATDCQVLEIPRDKQSDARAKLVDHSWHELSWGELHSLVGSSTEIKPGIPVLLRAVLPYLEDGPQQGKDRFSVRWNSGKVGVVSFALRGQRMPVYASPIIAILPAQPEDICVEQFTAFYDLPPPR